MMMVLLLLVCSNYPTFVVRAFLAAKSNDAQKKLFVWAKFTGKGAFVVESFFCRGKG